MKYLLILTTNDVFSKTPSNYRLSKTYSLDNWTSKEAAIEAWKQLLENDTAYRGFRAIEMDDMGNANLVCDIVKPPKVVIDINPRATARRSDDN